MYQKYCKVINISKWSILAIKLPTFNMFHLDFSWNCTIFFPFPQVLAGNSNCFLVQLLAWNFFGYATPPPPYLPPPELSTPKQDLLGTGR
jgi:hypothetical protein